MRKLVLVLALVAVTCGLASALTTDSVLLTVTPVFNLSVNISSATHSFGSNVTLRTSVTICVGQIENDGNVSTCWQKMTPLVAGSGGTAWSLKTSGTPARDEFRLLAISTGVTTVVHYPGAGTAADSCISGDHALMQVTNAMTDLTEGGLISPNHVTGETKKLWTSIMMPYDVTTGNEQTITLSIRAQIQ